MQNQQPSMLGPVLIAGGVFGFLSGVPLVGAINCLCCALVIACGFVAAYLYSKPCKDANVRFTAGNGALVGLVSGLVHGVVASVVGGLFQLALGGAEWRQAISQMEQYGQMDPQVIDSISRFMESTGPFVLALIGLLVWFVVGAIFATLGGVIGGAVFKHEPPPPTPVYDSTPPPPVAPDNPPPPPGV